MDGKMMSKYSSLSSTSGGEETSSPLHTLDHKTSNDHNIKETPLVSRSIVGNSEIVRQALEDSSDVFSTTTSNSLEKSFRSNESKEMMDSLGDKAERNSNRMSNQDKRALDSSSLNGIPDISSGRQQSSSSIEILSPTGQDKRRKRLSRVLTIDKLDYSCLGLYGRDKEVSILQETLNNVTETTTREEGGESIHPTRAIVLVSGYSGTGKTSLVRHALKQHSTSIQTNNEEGILVASGKFDYLQQQGTKPYVGISLAFNEICCRILALQENDPKTFKAIQNKLKSNFDGGQMALLVQVIPALSNLILLREKDDEDNNNESTNDVTDQDNDVMHSSSPQSPIMRKNQLHYSFRCFVRIISYYFRPLVVVLDDLHWADGSSLDLIENLLSDRENSHFMVIGMYRSNEVHGQHLVRSINSLRSMVETRQYFCAHDSRRDDFERTSKSASSTNSSGDDDDLFSLVELCIGNLDLTEVHHIIQGLLSTVYDMDRTLALAEICLKKTHGNAFFLIHFVDMLYKNKLLRYNIGTLKWIWDDFEIEQSTQVSNNVADLLKRRMMDLSSTQILTLQHAALLGSSFHEKILSLVCSRIQDDKDYKEVESVDINVNGALLSLMTEGYIEKVGVEDIYRWVHDKIQEAAISLIEEDTKPHRFRRLGTILLVELDDDEMEAYIFVVVNLLNEAGIPESEKDRIELAHLNYRASQKAESFSAFHAAAEYAAKGIQMLDDTRWENHYRITLKLYSMGAKAEGCIGHVERMERYSQEVLAQEHRPIEDKFPVYFAWLDSITNRGRIKEAINMIRGILKKFNCRFPDNPILIQFHTIRYILGVVRTLESMKSRKIPKMTDPTRMDLMRFLDRLFQCWYYARDRRTVLVTSCSMSWTLRYGFCDYSPVAFATTGLILTGVLQDFTGGAIYGEKALMLTGKTETHCSKVSALVYTYYMVLPWTIPLRDVVKPLFRIYQIGMASGETEALWAIYFWTLIRFQTGYSLDDMVSDCLIYYRQMKDLKREKTAYLFEIPIQAFLNLMGLVDDPLKMVGDIMKEGSFEEKLEDQWTRPSLLSWYGLIHTFLGVYRTNADQTLKFGPDYAAKAYPGSPGSMWDKFLKAVSLFASGFETGKVKYFRHGERLRKKLKVWEKKGNPNVRHYVALLDAEKAAWKGNSNPATVKLYEKAILLSARSGFLQDASLASERFAEFQLKLMSDRSEGSFRVLESIRYAREWGALARVEMLEKKYVTLL